MADNDDLKKSIPGLPSAEEMKQTFRDRHEKIREDWVKVYEAKLVRSELQKCYAAEGVNHQQECKKLAMLYMDLLKDAKIEGPRKIQR